MLTVKTFVEGPIDANNYLLIDEDSKDAVLIDCSAPNEDFIQSVKDSECNLKYILLTHGHFDHILGISKFEEIFGIKTYISKDDLHQIDFAPKMFAMVCGLDMDKQPEFTNFVKDGDELKLGKYTIKAISTPGHTKGSMCYLIDGKLFSGDTLFQGSVGRCDLLEGNFNDIIKSINDKLFILPDDTDVFTGHGGKTTIGFEKKYNEIVNI